MSFPSTPQPNPQPAQPHPTDNFAENLQLFWLKNRNAIMTCCTVVLLVIAGKGLWEFYVEKREKSIGEAYVAAGGATDKLKEFAAANPSHLLSGVATLRLADESYTAGKYADARVSYDKALPLLKGSAFADRARLGAAMAQVLDGRGTEGETALLSISGDASVFKAVRAEAAYHLAVIFSESGRPEPALKQIDQVLQTSPSGLWAQRAMQLRATLPAGAAPASAAATVLSSELKLSEPGK